ALGFIITNTKDIVDPEPERTEVSVEKTWIGEKQDQVTVHLLADGKQVDTVELNEDNNWKHTFTDLAVVNDAGSVIEYTVEEAEVAGYTTSIAGNAALGFTITNTKDIVDPEPERTEVSVEKTWIGEKQDQVTVHLLADGKQVNTVDLNEGNNWKHSFTDLAVVNDAGSVIKYTVEEVEVAGYTTSIAGNAALGFIITNTKDMVDPEPELTEVYVEKTWIGEKQDQVTVHLLADGKQVNTVDLNEGNNWKHSFTDLAVVNDAGSVIKYTVEEVEVAGYTTSIAGNAALGFIITNTKDIVDPEPELTEVSVEKEWIGEKQDQVTVYLLADGKQVGTVDLNESNNWKHTFTDLVVVNDAGSVIKYTVEEVEVAGYTTSIAGNAALGFIITNTKDSKPEEPKPEEPKSENPKAENPKSEDPKHEKLPQTGEATNFLVPIGIVLIIIGLWTLITKTSSKV
ncbi:MAG: Cna B-type domain-containing protein, partial [Tetragenococcus koreensis]|nr:Cna B-type domain-containing protein [Tetragenococcus koreensis]